MVMLLRIYTEEEVKNSPQKLDNKKKKVKIKIKMIRHYLRTFHSHKSM